MLDYICMDKRLKSNVADIKVLREVEAGISDYAANIDIKLR